MSRSRRGATAAAPAPTPAGAAASRQTILDAAARLFRQHGYAATSLRTIADACGMKAGSLYYHFESKDRIVAEVLDLGVRRVFDEVRAAVQALPTDAALAEVLHAAIAAHLGALLTAHDFTSANIRIFAQVPPAVRDGHKSLRRAYEEFWVDLLAALQRRGRVRAGIDLRRTVVFLFGAMNWTAEWHGGRRGALPALAAELAALVSHGLGATAPVPVPGVSPAGPDRPPSPASRRRRSRA